MQIVGSPRYASVEQRGPLHADLLLHKIDEVNKSVKVMYLFLFAQRNYNNTLL